LVVAFWHGECNIYIAPGKVPRANETKRKGHTMNLMTANTQWMNRPEDERFQTLGELKAAVEARRKISRAEDVVITDIKAPRIRAASWSSIRAFTPARQATGHSGK
jgi:hypothetical protein